MTPVNTFGRFQIPTTSGGLLLTGGVTRCLPSRRVSRWEHHDGNREAVVHVVIHRIITEGLLLAGVKKPGIVVQGLRH